MTRMYSVRNVLLTGTIEEVEAVRIAGSFAWLSKDPQTSERIGVVVFHTYEAALKRAQKMRRAAIQTSERRLEWLKETTFK